jgi:superoxide reductase
MTEKLEVYKCEVCGNLVEVLHAGAGDLVCCGQNMAKMEEQTADYTTEKHVPVVQEIEGGILIKVGSVPHPMMDEHYIEFVELIQGDLVFRRFLEPGMEPEAEVVNPPNTEGKAREYCNVHGLWKN